MKSALSVNKITDIYKIDAYFYKKLNIKWL